MTRLRVVCGWRGGPKTSGSGVAHLYSYVNIPLQNNILNNLVLCDLEASKYAAKI